ncbi:MAG: hypothetical protein IPM07_16565 [Anaerolineales bacterium]|nr:hypothetical protein [Anaerolineales bacterium]
MIARINLGLVEHYPTARAALEEADAVLGFALSRLMLDGPETELTDTINAQPALMAASMAAMRTGSRDGRGCVWCGRRRLCRRA